MDVTNLPAWPPRPLDSNKGTYGRVLLVAGSRAMAGAAILAARACLRGGAGLVRVACPESAQPIIAGGEPCAMTAALSQTDDGVFSAEALDDWRRMASASDVVAIGPGLGRGPTLDAIVPSFVSRRDRPMVVDADALNAMVGHPWDGATPVVITPHPGEFGRLAGLSTAEVQKARRDVAVRFAKVHGIVVVLKGHESVVTDGDRVLINRTGNPGMATAGAGDVLTGLAAALLAQGFSPFDAAVLAVNRHGRAGDLARDAVGEISLIASDLLDFLPKAIRETHP